MNLGLAGRVAVITAASKGLGRATAQALAAEGVKVVINARDATRLGELASRGSPGRGASAGDAGPRTVGKSALLHEVAEQSGQDVIDLDDLDVRAAVASNPTLFASATSPAHRSPR